jgi:hypothetical protein
MLSRVKKLSLKGKLAGFEAELGFEIDTVGKPHGTTLARAFESLHNVTGKPIVFIVDEAQHALSTKPGASTLFALKAARDALNVTSDAPQLAILATGSVRGKLADLAHKKTQAFYGATVRDFPLLGRDFVEHLLRAMLSHRLSEHELPDADKVMKAFVILGHRPEELQQAISGAYTRPEHDLADAILAAAQEQRARLVAELKQRFDRLPDLQRSILGRMAAEGADYRPFTGLERYERDTGQTGLSWAHIQKALEWLIREGFVWRSSHGAYDIDDRVLADYLATPETRAMMGGKPQQPGRRGSGAKK